MFWVGGVGAGKPDGAIGGALLDIESEGECMSKAGAGRFAVGGSAAAGAGVGAGAMTVRFFTWAEWQISRAAWNFS